MISSPQKYVGMLVMNWAKNYGRLLEILTTRVYRIRQPLSGNFLEVVEPSCRFDFESVIKAHGSGMLIS